MTDPDLARRVAALSAPKDSWPAKHRRHPAGTSRIVVAGLSATALFSLIAVLTLSAPPQVAAVTQPVAAATPPPPKQVVVIVHRPVFVPVAVGPTAGSDGAGRQGTRRSGGAGTTASPSAPAAAAPAATPAPVRAPSPPVARPAPVTTTKTS